MYKKERLNYLDDLKGIGIFLVVLGHIYPTNNIIRIWIYSFHMPLFFIISGIVLRYNNIENRNIKNIIISKFNRLVIPYITFELIAILVWMIRYNFTFVAFKWSVVDSFLMYCKEGSHWFFPSLFTIEILFVILLKLKNKIASITIILVCFILPFIFKTQNHYLIVIFRCFIGLGFLAIGYYSYRLIINYIPKTIYLIFLLLIGFTLSRLNGYVDLWDLNFKNIMLYIICSLLSSISLILLFKNIKIRYINYFGVNTVIILGIHGILLKVLNFTTSNYFLGIFMLISVMIIQIPIIYVINNYAPWILGKFNKKEKEKHKLIID